MLETVHDRCREQLTFGRIGSIPTGRPEHLPRHVTFWTNRICPSDIRNIRLSFWRTGLASPMTPVSRNICYDPKNDLGVKLEQKQQTSLKPSQQVNLEQSTANCAFNLSLLSHLQSNSRWTSIVQFHWETERESLTSLRLVVRAVHWVLPRQAQPAERSRSLAVSLRVGLF